MCVSITRTLTRTRTRTRTGVSVNAAWLLAEIVRQSVGPRYSRRFK